MCSDSASLAFTEAKEATATELATLLSLPEIADETTLLGLKSLIRVVQDPVLNLANRMLVESSAPVKEEFQKVTGKYFFSSVESLDLKKLPEASRKHINSWVEGEKHHDEGENTTTREKHTTIREKHTTTITTTSKICCHQVPYLAIQGWC